MRLSYEKPLKDDETLELAGQLMQLLLASKVTYQKANDALSAAQEMLMRDTRPVIPKVQSD